MKKVFTNRELPHIWANQLQQEGRGSHMFFEGKTIYSYGRHFPIATLIPEKNIVLFNANGYSNTTTKHKRYVWGSWSGNYTVIEVPGCSQNHKENIEYFTKEFNDCIDFASTATKNKEYYLNSAKQSISKIEQYLEAFGLNPIKFKGLTAILKRKDNILPKELEEKLKKAKLAERKRILEENKQNIQDWINCNRSTLPYKIDKVYLRKIEQGWEEIDGIEIPTEKVETSKGAKVNYDSAKLLYNMIKAGKDIKGHKIDGYTVIGLNGVLTIGCHKIERKEIDRFAKSQNW